MTRHLQSIIMLLILGLSCNPIRHESQTEQTSAAFTHGDVLSPAGSEEKQEIYKHIRFAFTAEGASSIDETIEIKASLYNDNADTLYFLSSSCQGEQYSLRFDTTQLVLTPFVNCNASYPTILKIEPNGQHDFHAHFRGKGDVSNFKLGFDLYLADESIDLNETKLADIHGRNDRGQMVIWAD